MSEAAMEVLKEEALESSPKTLMSAVKALDLKSSLALMISESIPRRLGATTAVSLNRQWVSA